jgi:UDP-N-acetylglucosamine 1-carboxyvinyltransferase
MIEAGTYLCASLITGGDVSVHGFNKDELCSLYEALGRSGVSVNSVNGGVSLIGVPDDYISIATAAYPGFPTDLQPIVSALLAVYRGGEIVENVWQGRFGYLGELSKLGVEYSLRDNRAYISHSDIHAGTLSATDLRGGAAAILLALTADGVSVIECGEYILRGYAKITEKLRTLGADIRYVE